MLRKLLTFLGLESVVTWKNGANTHGPGANRDLPETERLVMLLLFLFREVGAKFQPSLTAWQDRAETKAYGLFRGNGTGFVNRGSVNRDELVVEVQGDASLFGRMLFLLLWRQGVLLLPLALSWTDDLAIIALWKNRSGSEA